MSWFAKVRSIAALGAMVTTGLVAGAFLSVSSAKERKDKTPPPVTNGNPDGGATDAKPSRSQGKSKKAQPPAERVRRAQPIPRDYVE